MPLRDCQLALPFYATETSDEGVEGTEVLQACSFLEAELARCMDQPVELKITDNRHTMLSSRERQGVQRIRLHRMFLNADHTTVRMLARFFLRRDRQATRHLDAYIAANRHQIQKARSAKPKIRTEGRHYDLQNILAKINQKYFDNQAKVPITWGRLPRRSRSLWRRQRSIHLGSYSPDDRIIRIHPVLDQAWIPEYFLHFVVYHEVLHHLLPAKKQNGKHCFHTPEFRHREKNFEFYAQAIAWEKRYISKLLRSSRQLAT